MPPWSSSESRATWSHPPGSVRPSRQYLATTTWCFSDSSLGNGKYICLLYLSVYLSIYLYICMCVWYIYISVSISFYIYIYIYIYICVCENLPIAKLSNSNFISTGFMDIYGDDEHSCMGLLCALSEAGQHLVRLKPRWFPDCGGVSDCGHRSGKLEIWPGTGKFRFFNHLKMSIYNIHHVRSKWSFQFPTQLERICNIPHVRPNCWVSNSTFVTQSSNAHYDRFWAKPL